MSCSFLYREASVLLVTLQLFCCIVQVEIALFKQQGRGLLAKSQIRKGEQLLKIPQHVLLTPDAAVIHSRLGRDLEKEGVPAWSALAVALVESRFVDSDSEWRPYAQALPQATGCVLEWGSEEVRVSFCSLPVCKPLAYCSSSCCIRE